MTTYLTKNLYVLRRKEVKVLLLKLKEQWGFEGELDYVFLKGKEDKIFIATRDITKIEWDNIRINSSGIYIAKETNGQVRLSIEGSQLIGPHATKNVIEISEKLARLWMKGYNIPFDEEKGEELKGFQIMKCKDDFMATGIFKENRMLNFVPKNRRISSSD
ncbi:MAG: hypothetical protein U9R34_06615 [Nanoarchaeota archaeon]|nr:hypothetical protein [Nanoarchaeota archaeon]